MGMVCYVLGLSADQIATLRATPSLIPDLTNVATHEPRDASDRTWLERMPEDQRRQWEAAERQREAEVAECRSRLTSFGAFEPALNLDKAWHLLHYAITGTALPTWSDGDVLLLGDEIGPDTGYGPARLHDLRATRKFAELLASLEVEDVRKRLRLDVMRSEPIYGLPMGDEGPGTQAEIEMQDYVACHFPRLRDFVIETALKSNGLLVWIC